MCRILLVDDDEYVLSALRRKLLRKPDVGHDGLEIEAFSSPEDALRRVQQREGYFDVAIVDYHMPIIDGVAFLEALREIQPDAARIILSAHSDMEELIGAINKAHIDYFIAKPWVGYDLKGVLLQALKHGELRQKNRLLAEMLRRDANFTHRPKRKEIYQVMAVDDDENLLKALKRELERPSGEAGSRQFKLEVSVYSAQERALAAASEHPFDVVIADYAMPSLDGIEFLGRLRKLRPDAVRILLSGKADVDVLVEAVNAARVYHYMLKPWFDFELRSLISQALVYREMELENRILADLAMLRGKD
jgi:DNA-binding NtrC family response regulator